MLRTVLAIGLSLGVVTAQAAPESYTIDPSHTYPNFAISHLGFSTMWGQFQSTKGTMQMDRDAGNLSVSITIEAKSLTTGHQKRDAHLRSPDFFNVAEFPTLTFESTGSTWSGGRPTAVDGELTMMGVTRKMTLAIDSFRCAEDPWKKFRCGADASASIKRSDFGMKYGLPGIGDDVRLIFEIEAIRN